MLHWEDFALTNANRLLATYRERLCTFNDDIQGTAAIAVGAILSAINVTGLPVTEQKSKAWPDSPRALAGRLRRAATFLRKTGIEISLDREGHARTRVIRITKAPEVLPALPSAPTASSSPPPKPAVAKGFQALRQRTIVQGADDTGKRQLDDPLKTPGI